MGSIKAIKLTSEVSAFIQLPAGVHIIGDKKYTVSEKIENAGTGNEWKTTVVDFIEPAEPLSPTTPAATE